MEFTTSARARDHAERLAAFIADHVGPAVDAYDEARDAAPDTEGDKASAETETETTRR